MHSLSLPWHMSSFRATLVNGSSADHVTYSLRETESCQIVFNTMNSAHAIHLLAHLTSDTLLLTKSFIDNFHM
jgi:hypothetical protein